MIYVDRSASPIPAALSSRRADFERERIARILTGSWESLQQTRIEHDPRVWLPVKPALFELLHGKCAYCESSIDSTSADLEHFRPKTGAEEPDGKRHHYYYAWLAYEWENLLLACAECNRSGKRDRFPVRGGRARVLASVEECRATEEYLLLDPCFDRPENHLSFDSSGTCKALTERGKITIQLLKLNRTHLVANRRQTWQTVQNLAETALLLKNDRARVSGLVPAINAFLSGHRPYTAAARAAFRSYAPELAEVGFFVGDASFAFVETAPTTRGVSPETAVVPSPAEPLRRYKGRAELPPRAYETLSRIEVRNFKALESVELDLRSPLPGQESPPALMLLGENATGKSSVLEAVALALLGTKEIERLGLRAETFVRRADERGAPPEEPTEIVLHFDGEGPPVKLTIDPLSGRFEGDPRPATVLLGYGPRRFFTDRRRVYHSPHPSERVRTLFDPLAVIANPTSWLINCGRSSFNAAIRALRQLLLLPDEALLSRPQRGQRRGAEILFEVQGEPERLSRLSEGYKTTIATGVDIMREMLHYWPDLEAARGIVLIDEIDTHLHPRWKMRIVDRLRSALPRVQFLATTHDPLCLRGLEDGEVQVLRRDEENRIEPVADLPNVRGLSVEQLLTSKLFGLFSAEDPGFEEDMERYAALAAQRDRSPDEESELEEARSKVLQSVTLGSTPAGRMVQAAAGEYLLQLRQAAPRERQEVERSAVNRLLDLWRSTPAVQDEEP